MGDFVVMSIVVVWSIIIIFLVAASFEQHIRITNNEKRSVKNELDISEIKRKLLTYEQERKRTKETEGPETSTSETR